jgi:subfamily B ATP-binding cassette protein MsbA
LVFEALDRLMQGKTAIVIAHRLSTVRRANCIFVIESGGVVESGTHDELMQLDGTYQKLHEIQFSREEMAST